LDGFSSADRSNRDVLRISRTYPWWLTWSVVLQPGDRISRHHPERGRGPVLLFFFFGALSMLLSASLPALRLSNPG
jgi:hypothetical protein